jgi:hypothetical protein
MKLNRPRMQSWGRYYVVPEAGECLRPTSYRLSKWFKV